MIVCLFVDGDTLAGDDAGSYAIGTIEVTLNYSEERMAIWLDEAWALWKEKVPHPDSDSQFIGWLIERNPSWVKQVNTVMHHTFL